MSNGIDATTYNCNCMPTPGRDARIIIKHSRIDPDNRVIVRLKRIVQILKIAKVVPLIGYVKMIQNLSLSKKFSSHVWIVNTPLLRTPLKIILWYRLPGVAFNKLLLSHKGTTAVRLLVYILYVVCHITFNNHIILHIKVSIVCKMMFRHDVRLTIQSIPNIIKNTKDWVEYRIRFASYCNALGIL